MELLQTLAPHMSHESLSDLIRHYNGSIEDALSSILESNDASSAAGDAVSAENAVILPENNMIIDLAKSYNNAQVNNSNPLIRLNDNYPNTRTATFPSIKDGNCLAHAMGLTLAYIVNKKIPHTVAENKELGQEVRACIYDFMWLNWDRRSILTSTTWHETVYLAHCVGITEEERLTYNDWGDTAQNRLDAWMQERDNLYLTTSEVLAFCEMMHHMHIYIVFRTWRRVKNRLQQLETVPNLQGDGYIVFDLLHSGVLDSAQAHYELLKSGSTYNPDPKSKKRKRLCKSRVV